MILFRRNETHARSVTSREPRTLRDAGYVAISWFMTGEFEIAGSSAKPRIVLNRVNYYLRARQPGVIPGAADRWKSENHSSANPVYPVPLCRRCRRLLKDPVFTGAVGNRPVALSYPVELTASEADREDYSNASEVESTHERDFIAVFFRKRRPDQGCRWRKTMPIAPLAQDQNTPVIRCSARLRLWLASRPLWRSTPALAAQDVRTGPTW